MTGQKKIDKCEYTEGTGVLGSGGFGTGCGKSGRPMFSESNKRNVNLQGEE